MYCAGKEILSILPSFSDQVYSVLLLAEACCCCCLSSDDRGPVGRSIGEGNVVGSVQPLVGTMRPMASYSTLPLARLQLGKPANLIDNIRLTMALYWMSSRVLISVSLCSQNCLSSFTNSLHCPEFQVLLLRSFLHRRMQQSKSSLGSCWFQVCHFFPAACAFETPTSSTPMRRSSISW